MDSTEGLQFPFRMLPLSVATQKHIAKHYLGVPNGLVSCNQWGFKQSATATLEELEELYNHPLDPRDIWVVTPPKCGTTWMQEMAWLIANDLDYEGAKTPLSPGRWTFPDFVPLCDKDVLHGENGFDCQKEEYQDPPRFVKTHLPMSMSNPRLVDTCKVIYVARNPKDACVSYYKHMQLMRCHDYVGDLETFVNDFMAGIQQDTPFVEHMIEGWNLRHHPNMCFIFFEDMKRDLRSQIRKLANFLGKSLTDADVEKLANHLRFDNFKNNPWCNKEEFKKVGAFYSDRGNFVRKGKTGDWKNHFTPEMNAKFDKWLAEKLKGSDIPFIMELEKQD